MENISTFNILLTVIAWILAGVARKPLVRLIEEIWRVFSATLELTISGLNRAENSIKSLNPTTQEINERLWRILLDLLSDISAGFDKVTESLKSHIQYLLNLIEPNEEKRGMRIVGSSIQFLLLLLFIYTDITLGYNNFAILFPEVIIPEAFLNLALPLFISSFGIAFALGMILFDLIGVTSFSNWDGLTERTKKILTSLVTVTLIFALILSTLFSLSRILTVSSLTQAAYEQIKLLATYAQSIIVIPLLITTALLFQGFRGILNIWLLTVASTMFSIQILGFVVRLLKTAFSLIGFIAGIVVTLVFSLFTFIVLAVLVTLNILFKILLAIIEGVIRILVALLDVIVFPITAIMDYISRALGYSKPNTKHLDDGENKSDL